MLCSWYLPFDASQDVRNFHQMIVDNIRKMVGRIAIRFDNNRVAFVRCNIVHHFTINQVVVIINVWIQFESDDIGTIGRLTLLSSQSLYSILPYAKRVFVGQFLSNLNRCQVSASIIIFWYFSRFYRFPSQQIQSSLSAKAIISRTIFQ